MGIITFAFGMGGPVANFAALLHMTVHSLTKSAIFFAVGHAAQKAGSQLMDDIRGLITLSPTVGWGLMIGSLAILGMPPFGVFASEFLILTTAMREQPWATPILLLALGVAFAAIFGRVQPMVFGETTAKRLPHPPALLPVFAHLATGAGARSLHPAVSRRLVSRGGATDRGAVRRAHDRCRQAVTTHRSSHGCRGSPGCARCLEATRSTTGVDGAQDIAAGGGRLLSLWADRDSPRQTVHARRVRMPTPRVLVLDASDRRTRPHYPEPRRSFPAAARMQRAVADLSGIRARDCGSAALAAPCGVARRLLSARRRRRRIPGSDCPRTVDQYAFVRVEGDGVHEIPVGPVHAGIIEPGHFRFSDRRREGPQARGAARATCTRASSGASPSCPAARRSSARRARLGRLRRRVLVGVLPGARGPGAAPTFRRVPPGCARWRSS